MRSGSSDFPPAQQGRPLDHPGAHRPHRLYFALTNHCNRACPWCSTCSSPSGSTFLDVDRYRALLPGAGAFEVQLEGGEPTVHPRFWEFVAIARSHPGCRKLVVGTNGVSVRRDGGWLGRLGAPLVVKLSVNHHLLDRDPGLVDLARHLLETAGEGQQVVLNVRLRRGREDEDVRVREAVRGLEEHANIFYLQRYGFASDEEGWDVPEPIWSDFSLVNPDGSVQGTDLVARSEAMRRLP